MTVLSQAINHSNNNILKAKSENLNIREEIRKSTLVYQFLSKYYNHENYTVREILAVHSDIGLIGPGSCTYNTKYEFIIKHAILHDAFGRFYSDFGKRTRIHVVCHTV